MSNQEKFNMFDTNNPSIRFRNVIATEISTEELADKKIKEMESTDSKPSPNDTITNNNFHPNFLNIVKDESPAVFPTEDDIRSKTQSKIKSEPSDSTIDDFLSNSKNE